MLIPCVTSRRHHTRQDLQLVGSVSRRQDEQAVDRIAQDDHQLLMDRGELARARNRGLERVRCG